MNMTYKKQHATASTADGLKTMQINVKLEIHDYTLGISLSLDFAAASNYAIVKTWNRAITQTRRRHSMSHCSKESLSSNLEKWRGYRVVLQ